ncbi:hypothetical protein ACX80J_06695 [Arthrobacter sp. MDB2-24]
MTSSPENDPSLTDGDPTPAKDTASRKLQDDPRAKLALAKKNQAGNPAAAPGGGHAKAAHESSKQGKKEKKVRW